MDHRPNLTTPNNITNLRHLNDRKLTITAINVNSLITTQKRYDLLELAKDTDSDIILISETKLNAKHKFDPAKFNFIRTDRPASTNGGGTATLIKKNIGYEQIRRPSSYSN